MVRVKWYNSIFIQAQLSSSYIPKKLFRTKLLSRMGTDALWIHNLVFIHH